MCEGMSPYLTQLVDTRAMLEKDLWSSWIYEHITCLPLTSEWQQTKNLTLGIEI